MGKMIHHVEYSPAFKNHLDIAEQCGQTYVGHGNPNAKILIVANEPGTVNEDIIKYDLNINLSSWRENIYSNQDLAGLEEAFNEQNKIDWNKFNPLWPYKGQCFCQIKRAKNSDNDVLIVNENKRPTSRTWLQYQKLVDMIYNNGKKDYRRPEDPIDFFERAFITDFSSVYGLRSKDISPEDRYESIKNRLPLFSSDFINCFSVIIVASGHYIRDIKLLNDLRKVFPGFCAVERVNDDLGWRNIHHSEDGKRILIHTKHFTSAIKDSYLSQIALLCLDVLKKQ